MFDYNLLKSNIGKTWKFGVSSFISYPQNSLDRLIISIFLPPNILGSFTIAKTISENLKILINWFQCGNKLKKVISWEICDNLEQSIERINTIRDKKKMDLLSLSREKEYLKTEIFSKMYEQKIWPKNLPPMKHADAGKVFKETIKNLIDRGTYSKRKK